MYLLGVILYFVSVYAFPKNQCIQTMRSEFILVGAWCAAQFVKAQVLTVGTCIVGRHLWIIKVINFLFHIGAIVITIYTFVQWANKEGNCLGNFTVCIFFISCIISFIGYAILVLIFICCLPCLCLLFGVVCLGWSAETLEKMPFNELFANHIQG